MTGDGPEAVRRAIWGAVPFKPAAPAEPPALACDAPPQAELPPLESYVGRDGRDPGRRGGETLPPLPAGDGGARVLAGLLALHPGVIDRGEDSYGGLADGGCIAEALRRLPGLAGADGEAAGRVAALILRQREVEVLAREIDDLISTAQDDDQATDRIVAMLEDLRSGRAFLVAEAQALADLFKAAKRAAADAEMDA